MPRLRRRKTAKAMIAMANLEDRNSDRVDEENFDLGSSKSEIAARLKAAIRNAGGNQAVALKSGVPIGTLNNYVRAVSDPKAVALGAIARACGVSLDWLVFGSEASRTTGQIDAGQPSQPVMQNVIMVPRYEVAAAAGAGSFAEDGPPAELVPIHEIQLRGLRSAPRNLVMMQAAGDSMEPTLFDGEPMLVDRSMRSIDDGIYVFRLDGQLSVKRLQLVGKSLTIISDNPAYPTREVTGHDLEQLRVLGKVVWPRGK